MRKLFLATLAFSVLLAASMAAHAADMAVKAKPAPPPAPLPPPFSWAGFYVGGNVGGAWAHGSVTDSAFGVNFSNGNNNGVFIGGGQLGFNYQINNLVLGVEGDLDGVANNNKTGNGVLIPALGSTFRVTSNDRWLATAAARFGVAVDRVLFYGKAGGGWVGNSSFMVTNVTTGTSITGSNTNTSSGWLVGAGAEWAFTNNLSAKFEYDYLGLSGRTFTVPVGSLFLAGDTFTTGRRNVQMAKVGLNYRFNWGGGY
ncbi:MAG TPA: outer membrane beta-barrel protein [Xanthobacteraceae bacterium]